MMSGSGCSGTTKSHDCPNLRIIVISDTHGLHRKLIVPDGDIVVHCGDWTASDTTDEYDDFFAWFEALPQPHKVLVAGNHEKAFAKQRSAIRARIPRTITYLEDTAATIAGLRFWGSPRTPGLPTMAFTHNPDEKAKPLWQRIPEDTDVLVTHGPPFGILDRNWTGQRLGDHDLLARVRVVRPRLHLFGHVHDQNGRMERWGTTFVNAAIGGRNAADLSECIQVIIRR